MASERKCCVVTGGRGFVARHLVEMLLKSRNYFVRIVDLCPSINLDPHEEYGILDNSIWFGDAEYVSADVREKAQVIKACQGADVVFHMAAPDATIDDYNLHYNISIKGTKNVIDACIMCKVKRLIYTSTSYVVFDGVHEIYNGDESMPLPTKHQHSYPATKAIAEELVINTNGKHGLLTCSLRPNAIFGPGDMKFIPGLITFAGKSKVIVGDGNNKYDFSYVENVAHAHICAEVALSSKGVISDRAAGKAYFITDREPIKFWEFISIIFEGLGYERPRIKIPTLILMPIGHIMEWAYKLLGPYGMRYPDITPANIKYVSFNMTYNSSKAKDHLGYNPIISLQDGLKRTIWFYSNLKSNAKIYEINHT